MFFKFLCLALLVPLSTVQANEAEVVKTEFSRQGNTWYVSTTLRHNDTGWDHYADRWRVVDASGKTLGERILFHPHEDEQPFTRSQSGITIPTDTRFVFVEAHDKVHGWSSKRVRVDLTKSSGERFTVK
jgi:hypothetical protein